MDSDEDDEEPQNEPGTSSTFPPTVPVLRHYQGPAANSQGPAASAISGDEDSEYSDEYSAQSQDSGRTVLHPDLYVLTEDEHRTMTPETHKYAAAARSFCFVTTENGDQQDRCKVITMPCVQRSLYVNEVTDDSGNIKVEVPKGVDGRTAHMLERYLRKSSRKYRSWVENEVSDLIDMRKVKTKIYVTGRWVLTIKTDKQGDFLKAKARWVLRCFQDKQKEYQQTYSPASTRPGFRMSCRMAASKSWNIFHIDLKTAFLQGQSFGANRDVVGQLPPEAGHPP